MKKNATLFFEHSCGHDADHISKSEAINLMEEYAENYEKPAMLLNPWTITIISMIFFAGILFGIAISSAS